MQRTFVKMPTIGTLETRGVLAALVAGGALLIVEMLVSLIAGAGILAPLRYAASIILREHAFAADAGFFWPLVGGLAVHIAACVVFGFVYGLVASEELPLTRKTWTKQIGIGALFGAAVWLIDFQVVARFGYHWFLATGQLLQLFLHIVAFGIPLALSYALLSQRHTPLASHGIGSPSTT
jgi:hypothetical protein